MISVLVIDDAVVVPRLITGALAGSAGIRVAGTALSGDSAVAKVAQVRPDVVTLDMDPPGPEGLTTLRALRTLYPALPIIVCSTLSPAGAVGTLDALAAGASDYVTKPTTVDSFTEAVAMVRDQLVPSIYALCGNAGVGAAGAPVAVPLGSPRRPTADASAAAPLPAVPPPTGPGAGRPVELVAVGCSTGGPDALTRILSSLPATLPVPVVVVQHMPRLFTRMFAQRLDSLVDITVVEAEAGLPLRPGTVTIAPGDRHLEVARHATGLVATLHAAPPENFCRPSVDVLFRSVASACGAGALAVVLTGMGQDGRCGAERLREVGAEIAVQDEETSVVWGMPGAVASAGLADAVLPIEAIAHHVIRRVMARRPSRTPVIAR